MKFTAGIIFFGLLSLHFACSVQASEMHHDQHHSNLSLKDVVSTGSGEIKAIDFIQHKVTIAHGAIPGLNWPAMTMRFKFSPATDPLKKLAPGNRVKFSFFQKGNDYVLQDIQPE